MNRPTPMRRRPGYLSAIALATLSFIPLPVGAGKDPDDRGYDVLRYALDLSLTPESSLVSGTVEATIEVLAPIATVKFDADSVTIAVEDVRLNGRPAGFSRAGHVLEVPLPDGGTGANTTMTVSIRYRARSDFDGRYDGGGMLFTRSETGWTVGTISQPSFARKWWPCNDRPSDKALVTLRCSAPRGMTVVSNGRMLSQERAGDRDVFTWATKKPIATYLVFLGAADYLVTRDVFRLPNGDSVHYARYAFPEDSVKAAEDFKNAGDILSYFSRTFLPYPFADEQFAVAEVDGRLTMENQTVVAMERGMVTGDRQNENTFVHETAHQWWGNYITPADWRHTWLNEGFAKYAEALYIESRKGPDGYRQYMDYLMDQRVGSYPGSVMGRDEADFWESFGPAVYYKGALTLHMLRRMMGDDAFFGAMRAYLRDSTRAYGNVTTEDFRRACEASHGADLGWFFRQWVVEPRDSIDRPVLAWSWEPRSTASRQGVAVTVTQEGADGPGWRLPFTIRVHAGGAASDHRVVDSLPRQVFLLDVPARADSVELDPGRDVFMALRRTGRP